ncbi:hypothetical protein LTR09_008452 [Extremus antarcticus]|uniref:Uncharacterized protein n=1 Tax=Extremus antarcticus TaxID=702011 RepID=A0AAJ0GAC9_9PEZI|nr:hypothetical protein LTR09_008452 [Extremus antarcticus]
MATTPEHLNIGTVTMPEAMDPSQLGTCGYVNDISPWTVQQTARLTIDPSVNVASYRSIPAPATSAPTLTRSSRRSQILGTAQSYLEVSTPAGHSWRISQLQIQPTLAVFIFIAAHSLSSISQLLG